MELQDFLDELIMKERGITHEELTKIKDLNSLRAKRYKALIDRLNLLFEDIPDTYTADAINLEGYNIFESQVETYKQNAKNYQIEKNTIYSIFICVLCLYKRLNNPDNLTFLRKYYFKYRKLLYNIGRNTFPSNSVREKEFKECVDEINNDDLDIWNDEDISELSLSVGQYEKIMNGEWRETYILPYLTNEDKIKMMKKELVEQKEKN